MSLISKTGAVACGAGFEKQGEAESESSNSPQLTRKIWFPESIAEALLWEVGGVT
jgi:hypothetical protein